MTKVGYNYYPITMDTYTILYKNLNGTFIRGFFLYTFSSKAIMLTCYKKPLYSHIDFRNRSYYNRE